MEYLIIRITDHQVDAAVFTLSGRTVGLRGATSLVRDKENSLADIAATIAADISGSPRIVLCLPPSQFAYRKVDLPLTDLRKVREILPVHLQGDMVLPVEEAVFDVLPSNDGAWLALWAKRSEVAHAIEIFTAAGCEPQIVSSAAFAWHQLPDLGDNLLLSDGSALLATKSGRVTHFKALDGQETHKQLLAILAAMEYSGIAMPEKLVCWGLSAETFSGLTDVPFAVEQLDLPESQALAFRNRAAYQQLASLFAVACACQAGELPDFRRGDLAWTAGNAKLRKKMVVTATLAVIAAVLLCSLKFVQYRAASADITSLNNSISSIYREIFPTRTKAVDEVSEIKGEIKKLSGADSAKGVLDLLKILADAKGATINGLFEAEVEGNTVRVKGDARSAQAANEFKAALGNLMSSVELGETKSRPDGTVGFSLTGTLKEGK